MSAHLDRARLQALLAGELTPEQERALADHLVVGCETCESALAELSAADEAALVGLLARAEATPASPPTAGLVAQALDRPAWWRWRWQLAWLAPAAAAALGLILWFVLAGPPAPFEPGERIKGPNATPEVGLTLGVVARGGQGEAQVTRLGPDARLPQDRTLVFQLSIRDRCHLGLARLGPEGTIEVLLPEPPGPSLELNPGSHSPAVHGSVAGLPLDGLRGRQVFVATCSTAPLDLPAALAPLARALAAGREPAPGELAFGHALAAVEVLEGAP
jgi:hypothetical protein